MPKIRWTKSEIIRMETENVPSPELDKLNYYLEDRRGTAVVVVRDSLHTYYLREIAEKYSLRIIYASKIKNGQSVKIYYAPFPKNPKRPPMKTSFRPVKPPEASVTALAKRFRHGSSKL